MSTNYQYHDEILVDVVDGKSVNVTSPDELCQPWDTGNVWDVDDETWRRSTDDEMHSAQEHLQRWINFPRRARRAFEEWTTPNGWDINVMADIMRELIELGVVDPNEEIAQ